MAAPRDSSFRRRTAPLLLLLGDLGAAFAGLLAGYWLRYETPVGALGIEVPGATLRAYLPLLAVGTVLLVATYSHLGLYDERMLLRRYQSLRIILRGTVFWLFVYLGLSLTLKFDPPISRLFVVLSFGCALLTIGLWRGAFHRLLAGPRFRRRVQQGIVFLGWDSRTARLAAELAAAAAHPYRVLGVVTSVAPAAAAAPGGPPWLGPPAELEAILVREKADILVTPGTDVEGLAAGEIGRLCERSYADWKLIPGGHDLFVSSLRLQTVGGVPLLGVENLAITRLFNRVLKRGLDVAGALAGLVLSAPVVAVLAWRIRRESPGPALFRQRRVGAHHREFEMLKLRSMHAGAEAADHLAQSTADDDPRLTPTGRFLRRWNLDELPQFWNVLRGEMSLVGPRPERPYHVARLSAEIPHYLPRHLVKPGITGWAQVNGLRGDTDLAARIEHDIYYIENWSLWLDLQILLLTVVRWRHEPAGEA